MVATMDPGEMLFSALDAGELNGTNDLLDRYPEIVDIRDGELRIPLHYAADCADLRTFQRILNLNRTLIDAQDQFGFTPLLVAVMAGNLDVVEFLIKEGAQLGQLDRDGHSVVHWAVVCGQLDALTKLLCHGAPTALADIHGAHPLHYSTITAEEEIPVERSEAILYVLLRHGAQLECADLDGRTPLLWAASDGNLRAFQSLIQAGANRFATDRDRLGVLHCAASHGHSQIIEAMLEMGHNWVVNAKDRNGDIPLLYASTYGHYECAKMLLEKGADPNHQDKRIRTAAHCAAAKGQLRVLKLLRQYGASFELQNYRGDLPFHEAVQMGSKEIVDWLLGIEPNFVSVPNFYGRTALHLAAVSGNMELVVLLCSRNAPINSLMLYKGELLTPVDVARKQGHDLIVDYLTTRWEALSASQISNGKKELEKQNIEEQLKTAKLRKVRAELLSNELLEMVGIEGGVQSSKLLRRGKSMLIGGQKNGGEINGENNSREMVDASTMVSRRSSSASGVLNNQTKVPKSTSTTDLRGIFEPKRRQIQTNLSNVDNEMLMEQKIQRIVQEELQRAATTNEEEGGIFPNNKESHGKKTPTQFDKEKKLYGRSASEIELEPEATGSSTPPQLAAISPENQLLEPTGTTNLDEIDQNEINKKDKINRKRNQKGEHDHNKKVYLALKNGEYGTEDKAKKPRRRWTPGSLIETERKDEEEDYPLDEAVTKLHIFEDGLSPPPPGRMTFGDSITSPSSNTRYVHERAIFDELTHLKRMQIQYGKVREEVLVRSLVQNFCRMHAIHPSHFRRITTFYQWEKFLYDQLKQIYLEERERLSAAAAAAAQKAASAVGMRPGAIYSAQQRIFAATSSTSIGHQMASSSSMFSHSVAGPSRKFESRIFSRTNPLDQRLQQDLSRIYNNGSDSRSSATSLAIAATNSIAAQASANVESRRRRQQIINKHGYGNQMQSIRDQKTNQTQLKMRRNGEQDERGTQKHYKRCECLGQN